MQEHLAGRADNHQAGRIRDRKSITLGRTLGSTGRAFGEALESDDAKRGAIHSRGAFCGDLHGLLFGSLEHRRGRHGGDRHRNGSGDQHARYDRDKGRDPWTSRAAVDEWPNHAGLPHDAARAAPAKIPVVSAHAHMAAPTLDTKKGGHRDRPRTYA